MNKKALILGIVCGAIVMRLFLVVNTQLKFDNNHHGHTNDVHVHADFLMMIDGKKIDLTQDKYQSKPEDIKHEDIHLHDHQGNIIHRHAENVTFGEFLRSIGFSVTDECLTLDNDEKYCADKKNKLLLFVNKKNYSPISDYIIQDNDQIMLYYGENNSKNINNLLESITDEACIYSGTCPERGTPPPEACGLTCEVDANELYSK